MRKYTLVDKATGEENEADADTVERITGIEIGYIDWVLIQDGKFKNGDWEVRLPCCRDTRQLPYLQFTERLDLRQCEM